ncbi:serpin-ZX [Tanacetum coccineum]
MLSPKLCDAQNGFKNGNFVCSPLSLEIILGMLAAGAEGETLKQLLEFLGHESIDQILSESPTQILSGVDVSLVNGVWVKLGEAIKDINSWVHKETNGLILKIIKTSDFSPDDLMIYVNALYFKGAYFTVDWTMNEEFYLINREKISVPFMRNSGMFNYGSFKDYKMIKFPYKSEHRSNKFSMYLFLPHEKDGLKNLLQLFHSNDALFSGDFDLENEWLNTIWVPKFKIWVHK